MISYVSKLLCECQDLPLLIHEVWMQKVLFSFLFLEFYDRYKVDVGANKTLHYFTKITSFWITGCDIRSSLVIINLYHKILFFVGACVCEYFLFFG